MDNKFIDVVVDIGDGFLTILEKLGFKESEAEKVISKMQDKNLLEGTNIRGVWTEDGEIKVAEDTGVTNDEGRYVVRFEGKTLDAIKEVITESANTDEPITGFDKSPEIQQLIIDAKSEAQSATQTDAEESNSTVFGSNDTENEDGAAEFNTEDTTDTTETESDNDANATADFDDNESPQAKDPSAATADEDSTDNAAPYFSGTEDLPEDLDENDEFADANDASDDVLGDVAPTPVGTPAGDFHARPAPSARPSNIDGIIRPSVTADNSQVAYTTPETTTNFSADEPATYDENTPYNNDAEAAETIDFAGDESNNSTYGDVRIQGDDADGVNVVVGDNRDASAASGDSYEFGTDTDYSEDEVVSDVNEPQSDYSEVTTPDLDIETLEDSEQNSEFTDVVSPDYGGEELTNQEAQMTGQEYIESDEERNIRAMLQARSAGAHSVPITDINGAYTGEYITQDGVKFTPVDNTGEGVDDHVQEYQRINNIPDGQFGTTLVHANGVDSGYMIGRDGSVYSPAEDAARQDEYNKVRAMQQAQAQGVHSVPVADENGAYTGVFITQDGNIYTPTNNDGLSHIDGLNDQQRAWNAQQTALEAQNIAATSAGWSSDGSTDSSTSTYTGEEVNPADWDDNGDVIGRTAGVSWEDNPASVATRYTGEVVNQGDWDDSGSAIGSYSGGSSFPDHNSDGRDDRTQIYVNGMPQGPGTLDQNYDGLTDSMITGI